MKGKEEKESSDKHNCLHVLLVVVKAASLSVFPRQELIIALLGNAVAQFKKYKCPRMKSHLSAFKHFHLSFFWPIFNTFSVLDSGADGRGILPCERLHQSL